MKRSEINKALKDLEELCKREHCYLPPFCNFTPEEWQNKGHEYDEVRDCMLGWDITDFGSGDFDKVGFSLITIRNGNKAMADKYPKVYAEKLLSLHEGQYACNHFHWYKTEDIINRGGGNVLIRVYNSLPDESVDLESDVTVHTDGRTYTVPAGTQIRLTPGESIHIQQYMYHDFSVEPGTGDVLLGEVSQCNDDNTDNRFNPPVGRFPEDDPKQMIFRVFTPLAYAGRRTVTVNVCFPEDFARKYSEGERVYEFKNSFFIYDKDDKEVPYTLINIKRHSYVKSPTLYMADVYTLAIDADLTPMGYTEFKVVPAEKGIRTRYIQSQRTAPLAAENKFIRLEIQRDGLLTIVDKRTGKEFKNLMSYCDGADIGDGWMHIKPSSDNYFYGPTAPESIECVYDGPTETCFRIISSMTLPEKIVDENGHMGRSEHTKAVRIVSKIKLGAESDFVEVETEIHNTVMDHRLQVLFPTGIKGDYYAGQAFAVIKRPCGALYETTHWKEPHYGDRNCNGIAFKRDDQGGLAFIAGVGFHEVNGMSDENGTLAMTMFRSFPQTVGNDNYSQIDGELLTKLTFNFRLMPLTAETSEADIIRRRDELQAAGPRLYTMYVNDAYEYKTESFITVSGKDVAVSIIKRPEDLQEKAMIIRVYNCSDADSEGLFETALPISAAYKTNMLEETEEELKPEGKALKIKLGARKINTYRIIF